MSDKDHTFLKTNDKLLEGVTDLEYWGLDMLAYIKQNVINNEPVWSIYAAEGSIIGNAPNRYIAEEIIRHNDMKLVTLH